MTAPEPKAPEEDDYSDDHDWQRGPDGYGLACSRCGLLHKNWAGRGCPGSPEALSGSVYW